MYASAYVSLSVYFTAHHLGLCSVPSAFMTGICHRCGVAGCVCDEGTPIILDLRGRGAVCAHKALRFCVNERRLASKHASLPTRALTNVLFFFLLCSPRSLILFGHSNEIECEFH